MKKVFLIFVIGFICLNQVEAKKIIGYFISKSNDTLTVTFNIPFTFFSQEPNYERIQWRIKYYDSNNQKQVLKPYMAKEIVFDFENEKIRMLSRDNDLELAGSFFRDNSSLFLQIITDGKLKLFKYYSTNSSPGMYNASTGMTTGGYSYSIEKYIMQKDDGGLFKTGSLSFKKDMASYLSDCPDLAKKIKDKVYRSNQIEQIVNEYNETCK